MTVLECSKLPPKAIFPKYFLPSLVFFEFDTTVPTSETEILIGDGEIIPHIRDLLRLTQVMESAYNNQNARSAWLTLKSNNQSYNVRYHFSKIRLIVSICNNFPHINQAAALIGHLRSSLILEPHWIDVFSASHIHDPIQGFQVAQYPLYKLFCLLDENWVEDDIGDSISELAYLRLAAWGSPGVNPPSLFLPTS
ncbi:hypothetical protein FB451DRAFT_1054229, partial [Mycena latifolia]